MSKEQKKIKQQKVKEEIYFEKSKKEHKENLKYEKKLKKSIEGLKKELFGTDKNFEYWVSQIWEGPNPRSPIIRIGNTETDTRLYGYTLFQQKRIIGQYDKVVETKSRLKKESVILMKKMKKSLKNETELQKSKR